MAGIKQYLEFIRFSHTVFALPFALAGMVVAARETHGWPGWRVFLLILAAMVGARTAAMAFNRIADRHVDAVNPRTAGRHLPAGKIRLGEAWALVGLGATTLFVAAFGLNPLCFYLAPVALVVILLYSLTKRFTDFTHFFLGLALGLAPIGGWLAVRGRFDWPPVVLAVAVVCWLAGFDVIYATQDYASDRRAGLRSLPVRWGIAGSLRFARAAHAVMWLVLAGFGLISGLGWPYWAGWAAIAAGLVYEHRLAVRGDPVSVNVASLRVNGAISLVFLAAVVAAVLIG